MTAESPMPEIARMIVDAGAHQLDSCMQCGTCTAVCPWPEVTKLSPRGVLHLASLGLEGYELDDVWRCVACGTCLARCPRGIDIPEVMRGARVVIRESGGAPRAHSGPVASLRSAGNPWSGDPRDRDDFFRTLGLPVVDASSEILFFPCCTQIYDPRSRKTATALAAILRHAGLRAGVLGERGVCCGDQARRIGAEDVFQDLQRANLQSFSQTPRADVVVSSPHCLHAFQRDVPRHAGLRAVHSTALLCGLLAQSRLVPSRPVPLRVTFHDPCFLGRHAGQFEAPRTLLRSIPALDLVEMPRNRHDSLCCGGGGGGLWLELPAEQRFAVLRVREALSTGANVIATACPFCVLMLEDAIRVLELDDSLAVMDVAELLARSLEIESIDDPRGGPRS